MIIKKEVIRTCIVSKKKYPKKDLLKITKIDNKFYIDIDQKLNGKSRYIKLTKENVEALKNKKILHKAFRENIPSSLYESIEKILENKGDEIWEEKQT